MNHKGLLMVVSGFSGAGKGTLMKKLLEDYDNYAFSVSMTTRSPREQEINGVHYFFVLKEEFEQKIAEEGFVEYASYCDNYYGTPKSYVEEQLNAGKDVILEIEIQGALKVKEKFPEALLLFVMPPSAEVLKERLMSRGTESLEVIQKRLERAFDEAKGIDEYEYVVINRDVDECVREIHSIVSSAKNKPKRNKEFIENLKEELKVFQERG